MKTPQSHASIDPHAGNPPAADPKTKRAALIIATTSAFMTPFLGSAVNLALPTIGERFHMNAVLLSWVATSYLLASAVFLVPVGRLADIYGRKRIFFWGIISSTLASLLCALSNSAAFLLFFRALQGISSAMFYATSVAILTSVFPPLERGRVLGINVAAVYIGLAAGPSLGGILTEHLSWRCIFLVPVLMGSVIIPLTRFRLPGEWAEAGNESFDVRGAVLYVIAIFCTLYGLSCLPAGSGVLVLAAGCLGLLVFIWWERRAESPVFELSLFSSNRIFALSNLAALINYSATSAVIFLVSLYLQHIKGLSAQGAGLTLVAQPAVMALFSPLAGRLSDWIEPRVVASAGMALSTISLILFIFAGPDTSLTALIGNLILLGTGFALFSSPNMNAIMGSVEKRFYGIASGSQATMRLLGMVISMAIVTLLFNLILGDARIVPEYHGLFQKSMSLAFLVFSVFCFGGVFASLARGRLRDGARGE